MSTRSLVAIKTATGFTAIYNHSDGYPEGVGNILVESFNTERAVKKLLKKGDGSTLLSSYKDRGETDVDAHDFVGTIEDFCQHARDKYWGEYVYVFEDGGWRGWNAYDAEEVAIPGNKNSSAKRDTQANKILAHFKDNSGIGIKEAKTLYGIKCLSARISELRKQGYCIETEPDRDGAVYYLV